MTKKIFIMVLVLTILTISAQSQSKNKQEKNPAEFQYNIVVTATRLETPAREVASSITVITSQELKRLKKTTILEVLQDVLGLDLIQNGGPGGTASVFLRGANSEHTLVLLDGVEINDPISPSRFCDLAHLSLANVDRIEILRGPQSTLYGSDALAGVINIITKKGQGKPKISFSSLGGSYSTLSSQTGISGSSGSWSYSLAASYFKNKGPSAASSSYEGNQEKDGYRNLSLSGRVGFKFNDNFDLDLILRSIKTKTDIDNFGGAYGDDPNNIQDYDALFFRGQTRFLLLKNRWEQKFSLAVLDYDRRHQNSPDDSHPLESEKGSFKSKLLKAEWQNNFYLHEANTLTFGLDLQQEEGESDYLSKGAFGSFSSHFPQQKGQTAGFYLQDQVRISGRFFATVGARLDVHSQFGSAFTYRLAPAYFIEKTGTKLKATLGTAFKSPSLYQLYAPGTLWGPIGNQQLKPEESTGWDVGLEQEILGKRISIGATYFYNNFKNLINFDYAHGYINIGRAQSKGIEFSLQAHFDDQSLFKVNYSHTEAKDKDKETYLLRRPKDKFSINLYYALTEKINLNFNFLYTGQRQDMDFSTWPETEVSLPAYWLVKAVASYNLNPHFQLFLRLDNIFDEQYEMIKGYGTPGFSALAGLKLEF